MTDPTYDMPADPENQQPKVIDASNSDDTFNPAEWIFPKKPSKPVFQGLPLSALTILVVEFCERLAYYGSSIMFVQYLNQILGFPSDDAAAINQGFSFWSYFTAIIGAYLADAKWGKFKVIALFGAVYSIGLIVLTLSSCPFSFGDFPSDPHFATYGYFIGIVLIGLGTGAIKSNVGPMCAEQMVGASDEDVERVFRYFYWMINCGAFFGLLVTPIIYKVDESDELQGTTGTDGVAYYYVYGYCAVFFVIGYLIFFAGSSRYVHRKPTGSPIGTFAKVIKCAIRNKKKEGEFKHWLYKAEGSEDITKQNIDDVRQILSILPIFSVFPVYWLLYNQMTNSFMIQADWLDKPSYISNATLQVVGPFVLIVFIPIHDKFVFPFIRSFGFKLGYITRMSIGFVIISTCFFYAFVVQYFIIQQGSLTDDGAFIGEGEYEGNPTSTISIWWQIYPFVAIAISEIWTSISLLEFSFSQAPKSLKSLVMACNNMTTALGSLLGIILKPLFIPSNIIYLFPILGGIQVLLAPFFYFMFRNYKEMSATATMAKSDSDDLGDNVSTAGSDIVNTRIEKSKQ